MVKNKMVLGVAAIVTATALVFGASSFNKKPVAQKTSKVTAMYSFEYKGADFKQSNVQNEANWEYVATPPSCSGTNKACTIRVPDTYVDASGSAPVLLSSINITATESSPNVAYVSNTAAGTSGNISNQP